MNIKTINVRVPESLYDQIKAQSKATTHTKSYLSVEAENKSWQIRDIHEGLREADAGQLASADEVSVVYARYGA